MRKDFEKWNEEKKKIDDAAARIFFHERDVWWCSLGANIGFEQDGRGNQFARPILVFKKFNNEVFWAIPLSTKIKKGKFYVTIELGDSVPRVAIISQLRLMDAKRLIDKLGVMREDNYKLIEKAVTNLCGS